MTELWSLGVGGLLDLLDPLQVGVSAGGRAALLCVMDEVAPGSVGTEADGVEGPARLGLVFGVSAQTAQLVETVGELTLVSIFTRAVLLERAAQLRLVAGRVDLGPRLLLQVSPVPGLAASPVPELVLFVHEAAWRIVLRGAAAGLQREPGQNLQITAPVERHGTRTQDPGPGSLLVHETVVVQPVHVQAFILKDRRP